MNSTLLTSQKPAVGTVRADVSVEVAGVLEHLVAEGAAVHPLVLSGFVSLWDGPAV